jgi:hypothetical protein
MPTDSSDKKASAEFTIVQQEKWPFKVWIMHGNKFFAELALSVDTSWKTKEDANAEAENAEMLRLANEMITAFNTNVDHHGKQEPICG